jgi:hypothetical protein
MVLENLNTRQKLLWLRLAGFMLALFFMIWLPIEDTSTAYVVPLAAGVCVWLAARAVIKRDSQLGRYLIIGALAGLAVAPLAVFLMVFKSGLHAHGFADFTLEQLWAVLLTSPYWGASGLLLGLLIGWLRTHHPTNSRDVEINHSKF